MWEELGSKVFNKILYLRFKHQGNLFILAEVATSEIIRLFLHVFSFLMEADNEMVLYVKLF